GGGVAIEGGGHFSACLEGNGGIDVLDTSSSAYGSGEYDVETSGGDGMDTLDFAGTGGKWGTGASVGLAMFGDGGGDLLCVSGIMPYLEQNVAFKMMAAGNGGTDVIPSSLQIRDAIGGSASFSFAGGRNDDQLVIHMTPSVLPGGELHVAMDGNDGNDQLLATVRNAPMGGLFELGLNGGLGADGLIAGGTIPGSERDASCQIHLAGDAGNDRVEANLDFAAGFLGGFDFSMDGGVGD